MVTPQNHIAQFISPRHGSNAWAQRQDVVEAWREGSQLNVRPMTLEWAPILSCNADCYGCPYRRSRLSAGLSIAPANTFARQDDIQSATIDTAKRVLDAAREGGIQGCLTTGGGEPTIWAPLIEMLTYSASIGMQNALYTNGFILGLDPEYASRLLAAKTGLVFVRVSINAVTPEVSRMHWGVDPKLVEMQLTGLAKLLETRNQLANTYNTQSLPSIQVSTIIDRKNVDDLLAICKSIAEIFASYRQIWGTEDRFLVRPMTYHGRSAYSPTDHTESVISSIINVCGKNGLGRRLLAKAGVDSFLGFGLPLIENGLAPSYQVVIENSYAERKVSLATGLFLIVGPNGSAYLSTEHNTDDQWSFGNLNHQSVEEIYCGNRRRTLLQLANSQRWGPNVAQPTSRTARLDRIAEAVRQGVLTNTDIEVIRRISHGTHSLLLD